MNDYNNIIRFKIMDVNDTQSQYVKFCLDIR